MSEAGYIEPPRKRVLVYVEQSDGVHELFAALAVAQGQIDAIPKKHKSHFGEYADLSDIRKGTHKQLAANGLCVLQTLSVLDGELLLVTKLAHKSGQWISSVVPIKQGANPQQTSAYTTYMRRMSLSALLGLATDVDDDGEQAAVAAAADHSSKQLRLEQRAISAMASAKNEAERKAIVQKAEKCVEQGDMSPATLKKLKEALTEPVEAA